MAGQESFDVEKVYDGDSERLLFDGNNYSKVDLPACFGHWPRRQVCDCVCFFKSECNR